VEKNTSMSEPVSHVSIDPSVTEKQQCPSCNKYFLNLINHKKCPKKHSEPTPLSPRKCRAKRTAFEMSDDTMGTDTLPSASNTVGDSNTQRGSTCKNRLLGESGSLVGEMKKELRKGLKKNPPQHDPLYDKLKKFHDDLRRSEESGSLVQKLRLRKTEQLRWLIQDFLRKWARLPPLSSLWCRQCMVTHYRVCSTDMQPGRQPWVEQNSERDSEGHIEQLFTRLSCSCIKFSLFY